MAASRSRPTFGEAIRPTAAWTRTIGYRHHAEVTKM
jgi:hypothetical protein